MSLSDSSRLPGRAVVAAAIVKVEARLGTRSLDAVAGQVYEPEQIFVIGENGAARDAAEGHGATWLAEPSGLLEALDSSVTHVWLLHDDAQPRPDALAALVSELERLEAAVAGSKLLRADRPEVLESVGSATDVFDVPYRGLEPDEVDQQQYDVIRDVAFVSGASMLVRRDLLVGIHGPDPLLAPEAAGIDLCQRARIAGGRVVVVPSSEVLHEARCTAATAPWAEQAGRVRAMLKSYSWVTLLWALPGAWLLGLLEALVRTLTGRLLAIPSFLRAWAWILFHLPSAVAARRRARRGRLAGDEELFRYQIRGSETLRRLVTDVAGRLRSRSEGTMPGRLSGVIETGQEVATQPAFVATAVGLLFLLFAVRRIWSDGLPLAGASFPLPDWLDAVQVWAGGWNVAGLGSPQPTRPVVAAVALTQAVALGSRQVAGLLLTGGAAGVAMIGLARLLRQAGVGPYARYLASLVLIGGPAAMALADRGEWTAMVGLAFGTWTLAAGIRPWPLRWRARIGRFALLILLTGLAAVFVPLAVVALPAAILFGSVSGAARWWAWVPAAFAAAAAPGLLMPWVNTLDPIDFLSGGLPGYWDPPWWAGVWLGVALLAVLVLAERRVGAMAGWGALLVAGGAVASRSAEFGAGSEVETVGLVIASIGAALVVGPALDLMRFGRAPWRRVVAAVGIAAAGLTVAWSATVAWNGRIGLPTSAIADDIDFVASRRLEGSARALLIGHPDDLPGTVHLMAGYAYRVVSIPEPRLWEAWLPSRSEGDRALEEVLDRILAGETVRAGEELAAFGIAWVIFAGPHPFEEAVGRQFDLKALSGTVFESEASAERAQAADGTAWQWDPPDYVGPAFSGDVRIAERADARWGPEPWEADGWANQVSGAEGIAEFGGVLIFRQLAWTSAGIGIVLLLVAAWGRDSS